MKRNKIVFLDFDGVLVTDKSNVGVKDKSGYQCVPDKTVIQMLNNICETTGAEIVISSMWRIMFSVEGLKMFLRSHGLDGKYFHDDFFTKDLGGSIIRNDEITDWLKRNKTDKFVILDDLPITYFPDYEKFLIQTKDYEGLTYFDSLTAIRLLGSK